MAAEATHTKLKLVEFAEKDPELWFLTTEALFRTNKIEEQDIKFSYLLQSLRLEQLERIKHIIEAGAAQVNPYDAAKKKLLDAYAETESSRLHKLLESSLLNSAEIKPSFLLEKIRNLGGKFVKDDAVLREMWLNRLPKDTRMYITAGCQTLAPDELAKQADMIWALQHSTGTNKQIFSVDIAPSHVAAVRTTPAIPPSAQSTTDSLLLTAVCELTKEIAALRTETQTERQHRSRYRSPSRERRGRSQSRRYGSPSPYRRLPEIRNGQCWYHEKFGQNARKCQPGCKHYATKNQTAEN